MVAHPDFSVIIPSYGRPAQLAACLASLHGLAFPPERYELLVVDDASAEPLDARVRRPAGPVDVRWVRLKRNVGPAAARNEGARLARGTHLAFIDDDCLADPGWLAALGQALAVNPGAAVGGRLVNGSRASLYCEADQAILDVAYAHHNRDATRPAFFSTSNLAVPASGFREAGGFDARYRTAEDREFCARWMEGGRRLVAAPGAVVVHAATSSLGRFWRRHYAFGEGAYEFRSRHARPDGRRIAFEPAAYYGRLLLDPVRQAGILRGVAMSALVALSQLASALGFVSAWRAAQTSKGRTG